MLLIIGNGCGKRHGMWHVDLGQGDNEYFLFFRRLSGWSSIGAASQRSRIKWTSITENREIKKRAHPVGASAEFNPPGTNAFMVCGRVRFVHGERTGTRAA